MNGMQNHLTAACLSALLILAGMLPAWADQKDPKLGPMLERLATTKSSAEAEVLESQIWQTWVFRGEELVDSAMARGVIAMNRGAYGASLKYFNDVVRLAPDHAEGWNKRATVHFLMGNFSESVVDIQRTLELEPRHFGALSGLGIIYMEMGRKKAAIRAMEQALTINPHMDAIKAQLRELKTSVGGEPI